jgi:catechol 2,3-dioxygenase-like lactoylglutathione lyase family enzyme
MFDHVSVRVADLDVARGRFAALFAPLGVEQTVNVPAFALWGDFGLAGPDADHALTRRAHIAFVAPSHEAVQAFWQAGLDAGLTDNGAPGPRTQYGDDYYGAFLLDEAGNNFEAVVRSGGRVGGNVDHVALRVVDLAAATDFYKNVGGAVGFAAVREGDDGTTFADPSGGLLSVFLGEPTEALHVALRGDDDTIRGFHASAVAAGYRDNGGPGQRPYHPGYYSAFVLDPDGNNVEVVDHHWG